MLSKNGTGLIVIIISLLGGAVTEVQITDAIAGVMQFVGIVLMVANQIGRPDVEGFFFKK